MTIKEVSGKQWRAASHFLRIEFSISRLQRLSATLNVFSEASENPAAWVFNLKINQKKTLRAVIYISQGNFETILKRYIYLFVSFRVIR